MIIHGVPVDPTLPSLDQLLTHHPLAPLAWRAAQRAADILVNERPRDLAVDTKSTATDAVTEMDRRAEAAIVSMIRAERPDDGLLGEEGAAHQGSSGVRWVIDPLDATVNYTYTIPIFGVSVAVEESGVGKVGVVVAPGLGEAYLGIAGHGAWVVTAGGIRPVHVSSCTTLGLALVATGFGYDSARRKAQGVAVAQVLPRVRDIRRSGCAVVDLCWVAAGRLDAFYERGLNRWDLAAGLVIAKEAGAVATGLRNDDPFDFSIVSAPGIASEVRELLLEIDADKGP